MGGEDDGAETAEKEMILFYLRVSGRICVGRGGEVGIRGRLKICFRKRIKGSSPFLGTKKHCFKTVFFYA